MAGECEKRPLGELTENFDSIRVPVKEKDRIKGPYPYYGASGIVDYVDKHLFDGEYLLIAEDGENLRTRKTPVAFVAAGKFWVNNHAHIVCGNDQANTRYLMYALADTDISGYLTGSTMPKLTQGNMNRIPIVAPSLKIQQAIACILGALDDKIELNRQLNRTLEEMARAIFKSWFVNFDPVRAKAAGQQPPGLKPEIAALFPDSFEDSELGEIPKGWCASTVRQYFRLTMGQSPPGSTYNEIGEGVPFYQGRTDFGFRFPTRRVFCTAPTRFAETGDTLVSVRAPVGDLNIANERCAVGRGVAAIRHRSGSRSFTYYSMNHLGEHFSQFEAEGTVFGCINKADFERLPFVVPVPDILAVFDRIVLPLDDRLETNERQSLILASIRDALLPKLISGELRIADAERIAGRLL